MEGRAPPSASWRRWCGGMLGALLLPLATIPGCRKGETPATADTGTVLEPRRYTVRGEVVRLPYPARRDNEVFIRHEAIDDFVDSSGRVVGMASMIMPFQIEPPALAQGLAVGEKVEIRFLMDWSGPAFRVERVEKLPAATTLHFGPARPPAEAARPRHSGPPP